MKKHILIAGVPGTGKTTVGDYLQKNFGFVHYNFEDSALALYAQDPRGFITKALAQEKIVITWGFMPYGHTDHVVEIKKRGFTLIWFDGDRDAAFREFMKRGTVSEQAYKIQMLNIETAKVIATIKPKIINTFDKNSKFKKLEVIAKEVLENLTIPQLKSSFHLA